MGPDCRQTNSSDSGDRQNSKQVGETGKTLRRGFCNLLLAKMDFDKTVNRSERQGRHLDKLLQSALSKRDFLAQPVEGI